VIGFLVLLGISIFFAATQMRFTLFPTIGADVITAKLTYSPHRLYQCYPHPLFD
jgi:hypothetical protein